VPSSVSPGEDRDELSHLRTPVSLERVLGSLVDQVLALSLELLDQLLLESGGAFPNALVRVPSPEAPSARWGFPSASPAWACHAGISGSCDTSPIPSCYADLVRAIAAVTTSRSTPGL
jgi:hypothetical protein